MFFFTPTLDYKSFQYLGEQNCNYTESICATNKNAIMTEEKASVDYLSCELN